MRGARGATPVRASIGRQLGSESLKNAPPRARLLTESDPVAPRVSRGGAEERGGAEHYAPGRDPKRMRRIERILGATALLFGGASREPRPGATPKAVASASAPFDEALHSWCPLGEHRGQTR